jgi:cbb3-type cytochrome oxidase subunit 3
MIPFELNGAAQAAVAVVLLVILLAGLYIAFRGDRRD